MKQKLAKYEFLLHCLKPLKWLLILLLILMLLRTGLSVIDPYLSKLIIDGVTQRQIPLSYLLILVLVYILAIIVRLALEIPISYVQTRFEKRLEYGLKQQALSKLYRMDYTTFESYQSGDIISRIENDTAKVVKFIADTSIDLAMDALWIVSVVMIMVRIEWRVALLSLGLTPIIPRLFRLLAPKIRELSGTVRRLKAEQIGTFTESVNGMLTLRLYNCCAAFQDKLHSISTRLVDNESRLNALRGFGPVVAEAASALLSPGLMYGFGAYLIYTNQITVGDMLLFATYSTRLLSPLVSLTRIGFHWQEVIISADRLKELITAPCETGQHVNLQQENVDIAFHDVSFSYGEARVIDRLNLTIPFNSKLAIMGPSGIGKTTIANLLVGLLEPDSGTVLVNGIPTSEWDKQQLRRLITYVPQDTYLIAGSIYQNVTLGVPNATEEEVMAALEAACALEFVQDLPNGIYEEVLEGGKSLSGGQKQRIGLARALLRKSPVLILDEALGALDHDTEKRILDKLKQYHGTVIFITHKDSIKGSMETHYFVHKDQTNAG